jgi:hypothetical protein
MSIAEPSGGLFLEVCQTVAVFWGAIVGRHPEGHRRNVEETDGLVARCRGDRAVHLWHLVALTLRRGALSSSRAWSTPECVGIVGS